MFIEFYTKLATELGPELIKTLIQSDMKQGAKLFPFVAGEGNGDIAEYSSYNMLLAIFKEGQKCGEIRNEKNAEKLMEMMEAAFTGLLLYWSVTDNKFDLLERQQELLYMLLSSNNEESF